MKQPIPPHACIYRLRPHSEAGAFKTAKCEVCGKPQNYSNVHPFDFSPQEYEKLTHQKRHRAGAIQMRQTQPRVMGVD